MNTIDATLLRASDRSLLYSLLLGFLFELGALDYAGGGVVHISSGELSDG
jgi:ammonia channel protein AmtB